MGLEARPLPPIPDLKLDARDVLHTIEHIEVLLTIGALDEVRRQIETWAQGLRALIEPPPQAIPSDIGRRLEVEDADTGRFWVHLRDVGDSGAWRWVD